MNQLKKHLDDALSGLHTEPDLAAQILEQTHHSERKKHPIRRLAVAACLIVVCMTAVVAAITTGISLSPAEPEGDEISRYQVSMQPETVTLSPEVLEKLEAKVQADKRVLHFASLKEVEEFLGIPLLSSELLSLKNTKIFYEDGSYAEMDDISMYIGGGMEFDGFQICLYSYWNYCYADEDTRVKLFVEFYTYENPEYRNFTFAFEDIEPMTVFFQHTLASRDIPADIALSPAVADANAYFTENGVIYNYHVMGPDSTDVESIIIEILDSLDY